MTARVSVGAHVALATAGTARNAPGLAIPRHFEAPITRMTPRQCVRLLVRDKTLPLLDTFILTLVTRLLRT